MTYGMSQGGKSWTPWNNSLTIERLIYFIKPYIYVQFAVFQLLVNFSKTVRFLDFRLNLIFPAVEEIFILFSLNKTEKRFGKSIYHALLYILKQLMIHFENFTDCWRPSLMVFLWVIKFNEKFNHYETEVANDPFWDFL